ncbi:putative sporulation protein YtxC [Parageobacillus thermoglucosidasius]|uniref:Sporulation protein n=1 Tax=Parageobacillus thermoglucosidasius TaxID=1426 RepID=A0A1B7KW21_PARTM|nr:putative sporulation protein YtxC [Parageobacillus thermoglucosidasius]OAT74261.1 sporulation protein [Parageobacillus thermoglucosidasius]
MIEIYFEQAHDAEKLFCLLNKRQKKTTHPRFRTTYNGDSLVTIYIYGDTDEAISCDLIPAMTTLILHFIEDRLLLSIISNTFYFQDKEEQQQILQLAHSFLDGERYDYRTGKQPSVSRKTLIANALSQFLRDGLSFSFSSFVTFRLKSYMEQLQHYVELAIDEYKLEQEYQNFVQMLRDFVAAKRPKLPVIHLVHKPPSFLFFDEKLREITASELKQFIDRNLIVSQPMYIDSSLLAPLVSIAPSMIYLYTDHEEDGMVQTIQNVFQERIRLYRQSAFAKYRAIDAKQER